MKTEHFRTSSPALRSASPPLHAVTSALRAALLLFLFLAVAPSTAHAYIDPGTGSMIIQVLIAAVLGAVVTFKQWWGMLRAKLSGRRSDDRPPEGREPGAHEEQSDE